MRSVSPALGRISRRTRCAAARSAAISSTARKQWTRECIVAAAGSEGVGIVGRSRTNRHAGRPRRRLRRNDGPQLRLKVLLLVGGPLAQRRVAGANHFVVFANADRVAYPAERERGIERAKAAQH